jgi:glycosyltransferase involved in cell wall biosynthesis
MTPRVFSATNIPYSPSWERGTLPLTGLTEGEGFRRFPRALRNVYRLRRTVDPDDVLIFADDQPVTANLFGRLCGRDRPTLVRTDPLVVGPVTERRRRYLTKCLAAVDRLIVWAPAVIDRYERCLGLPRERMVAVHFHHTVRGYATDGIKPGDYVFSGGNSLRDYPTLLEAVRGLPIPVRVATSWRPPAGTDVPANVTLGPTSAAEFRTLLAGARVVVLPLRTDRLRTGGQQSYLNAMALGRPVVVTDPFDAPYYIEDRRTGRIVPPADPAALRAALEGLLDDPAVARALGERGRDFALPLDQEHTWSRVLAHALDAQRRRVPAADVDAALCGGPR